MSYLSVHTIHRLIITCNSCNDLLIDARTFRKGNRNFHMDECQGLKTRVPITTARYHLAGVDQHKLGSFLDHWTARCGGIGEGRKQQCAVKRGEARWKVQELIVTSICWVHGYEVKKFEEKQNIPAALILYVATILEPPSQIDIQNPNTKVHKTKRTDPQAQWYRAKRHIPWIVTTRTWVPALFYEMSTHSTRLWNPQVMVVVGAVVERLIEGLPEG